MAIGKEGQNARLAARLTGYKIDIKSESAFAELEEQEDALLVEDEPEEVMEEYSEEVPQEFSEAPETEGEETFPVTE